MRELSEILLAWYDKNARVLPWRVLPGAPHLPDPYAVWLSEIMLQQTTVATVRAYHARFMQRWPSIADLAQADDSQIMAEWAGLGYYARARNLAKCARIVMAHHGGVFPRDFDALLSLPGIGPYTAAAIGAIAFGLPLTVMDGNVERVMARMHNDPTPLPQAKKVFFAYADTLTPAQRPGDYAQAVMDLGASICTPKKPACELCPWRVSCRAYAAGAQAELPRKLPKQAKPTRHGVVYLVRRPADGAWLLERRAPSGLLGGMLGWPGTTWVDQGVPLPHEDPPLDACWEEVPGQVRHTFTHFHLILHLRIARSAASPTRGNFMGKDDFSPGDLPTLMRKAYDMAAQYLAQQDASAHD